MLQQPQLQRLKELLLDQLDVTTAQGLLNNWLKHNVRAPF